MTIKSSLRNLLAEVLYKTGVTVPSRCNGERLTIVTFHRVLPEVERRAYPYPGLAVTPEELAAYLVFFGEHYDCGTLESQHRRFVAKEKSVLPLLALTFDDGQFDNYRHARPVLAKHRLKASFFIPVVAIERGELLWHDRLGFAVLALMGREAEGWARISRVFSGVGIPDLARKNFVKEAAQHAKKLTPETRLRVVDELVEAAGTETPSFARLMTFSEIAELSTEGHEIGSHSMTHRMMPQCNDHDLEFEVAASRNVLQERLGCVVDSFCYPNGDCDERSVRAVAKAGYRRAVTTAWGFNRFDTNEFRLYRYDMDASRVRGADGSVVSAAIAYRMSRP